MLRRERRKRPDRRIAGASQRKTSAETAAAFIATYEARLALRLEQIRRLQVRHEQDAQRRAWDAGERTP